MDNMDKAARMLNAASRLADEYDIEGKPGASALVRGQFRFLGTDSLARLHDIIKNAPDTRPPAALPDGVFPSGD